MVGMRVKRLSVLDFVQFFRAVGDWVYVLVVSFPVDGACGCMKSCRFTARYQQREKRFLDDEMMA